MSTKNGGSLVLKILNTQRYTQLLAKPLRKEKAAPIFLGETRPRLTSEEGMGCGDKKLVEPCLLDS